MKCCCFIRKKINLLFVITNSQKILCSKFCKPFMLAYAWSCSVVELQSCDLFVFTIDARRIEVSLSHDKISFINSVFQKELDYWK